MSNFDFIRLPKELIKENKKINYRGNTIRPERLEKIFIDYYDWIKKLNIKDNDKNYNSWRMNVNSGLIQKLFIDPFIRDSFKADFTWRNNCPIIGTGGCEIRLYADENNEYLYFYTMNRWKRYGAFGDYKLSKSYRIILYKISYEVFQMLGNQNLYKIFLLQFPTGFRYRIMTYKQCLEDETLYLKIKPENNKEIKW